MVVFRELEEEAPTVARVVVVYGVEVDCTVETTEDVTWGVVVISTYVILSAEATETMAAMEATM